MEVRQELTAPRAVEAGPRMRLGCTCGLPGNRLPAARHMLGC